MVNEDRSQGRLERFKKAGIYSWSIIGIVILIGLAIFLSSKLRAIFAPLVYAIILTYILSPLVNLLQRLVKKRLIATILAYLIVVIIIGVIITFLYPVIANQVKGFFRDFPLYVEYASNFIDNLSKKYIAIEIPAEVRNVVDNMINEVRQFGISVIKQAPGATINLISAIINMVVSPVIAFYFIKDSKRIKVFILRAFPQSRRVQIENFVGTVNHALGGFIKGQLAVAFIVGVLLSIALMIIGVRYAIIIGMVAGLFNIIPYFGPVVGIILASLVAAFDNPIKIIFIVISFIAIQQIDNFFISPNIMRYQVGVHPVMVIFSLILGGSLFGFLGLILAVPITAVCQELLKKYFFVKLGD